MAPIEEFVGRWFQELFDNNETYFTDSINKNRSLRPTFRIFGCALDTPFRQNRTAVCFCARLFVSLTENRTAGTTWNFLGFSSDWH